MSIKLILLGCGSSLGVPRIDGNFGKCDPKNKKNFRTRCSSLISSSKKNILIDTSPDIRQQFISNKIKNINSVFYTHYHADQTHGINDLRLFYLKYKKKINIYSDLETKKYLFKSFKYCFQNFKNYPAVLKHKNLKKTHVFDVGKDKIKIEYVRVKHGYIDSLGYLINNKCAYISDANEIYKNELLKLKNLKYLIVDCLRYKKHNSHFNLDDILSLVKNLKPNKTILTNLHSDLDYVTLKKKLPVNIVPGYDGMTLRF